MNERINKLFGQAMDQSIPETWTTLTHSQLSILKDKFAELLVRECLEVVEKQLGGGNGDGVEWDRAIDFTYEDMKKHFGVELSTNELKNLLNRPLHTKKCSLKENTALKSLTKKSLPS